MKILVDEHIPLMTVRALRLIGHDVHDIRGTLDEGMQDDALWAMAQQEERLLMTTDKGFTQYRMARHHGVLIIRLRQPTPSYGHSQATSTGSRCSTPAAAQDICQKSSATTALS
jgi:predicted nuclease of predicted toxin-antitoxin system